MMQLVQQIQIQAKDSPVVLERILQVIRYRGYKVCHLNMNKSPKNKGLTIEVSVESDKMVENLIHQLGKIVDIEQIKVKDQAEQKITA